MRVYDGDFTVASIIGDCRADRRESINNPRVVGGIDLDMLNQRIQAIPVDEIRRRRARMNIFYEEVLVSADPDRGISFTSCLMILAHYNVISDSKSLRLEEFLRRRARLQRVEEAVRRNVVIGFFDTMFWSRAFRRKRHVPESARMTGVPSFTIPEIFVDDPEETPNRPTTTPRDFTAKSRPADSSLDRGSPSSAVSSPLASRGVSSIDTSLRRRDSAKSSPTRSEYSPGQSPSLSPLRLSETDTSYHGDGEPTRTGSTTSGPAGSSTRGQHVRDPSSVSASGVMESFDTSAWGESIRRSFSLRRPTIRRDRSPRASRR